MDPQELVPLEAGVVTPRPRPARFVLPSRSCHRAPLRLCRLLALLVLVPTMFILVPVYLRFRVYSGQIYPMSMTDMRLIDGKISPTWCQRQVVKSNAKSNATFNAFVVPGQPDFASQLVPVSMSRELTLSDDMKEYWGFYLLQGSTVTVSACVSFPGASLIMIKGYKHLQECAYIGDDSSEELDEIREAYKLGRLTDEDLKLQLLQLNKADGKANQPGTMKRHKIGVSFHDPSHVGGADNATSSESVPTTDVTDHDPKELRAILERLHILRDNAKVESAKHYQPPSHLMSLPALHRHRDANVDRDERRWLSFKDIDGNSSYQDSKNFTNIKPINVNNTNLGEVNSLKPNVITIDKEKEFNSTDDANAENIDLVDTIVQQLQSIEDSVNNTKITELEQDKTKELTLQETLTKNHNKTEQLNEKPAIKENIVNESTADEQTSKEVFEDVLHRLRALGDKGKRVLLKLHETMGVEYHEKPSTSQDIMSSVKGSDEELDRLRQVLVEAIDEEKTRAERQKKRHQANEDARAKRELMLGSLDLTKELNEDDGARDYAAEEGLSPDGYADHHEIVNETTPLDMSNSEFWSSFSSSEEALLECEGLILNLPLTPHRLCERESSDDVTMKAARANALTYRVPANGYYFFVFNSENEVQTNYIRAHFALQKTRYDVARTTLRKCTNSTEDCALPLDFFSGQKVVLELPLRDNDSLWNEQFVILSECEPRTSVYVACVITVPVLIILFAFQ